MQACFVKMQCVVISNKFSMVKALVNPGKDIERRKCTSIHFSFLSTGISPTLTSL